MRDDLPEALVTKSLRYQLIIASLIGIKACSFALSKILQQSLDSHEIPAHFKVGKVGPLHKSGNRHSPSNYRPISLTSIPCKILQHVLFSCLVNFLESNSFFHLGSTRLSQAVLVRNSTVIIHSSASLDFGPPLTRRMCISRFCYSIR